jgi:hypothetical protein
VVTNVGGLGTVVACYSKTLFKAKRNYCVIHWELLAVGKTMEHFYKYLYGQEFQLRTDHSDLTWLLSLRTWKNSRLTGSLISKSIAMPVCSLVDPVQRHALTSRKSKNTHELLLLLPCIAGAILLL